MESILSAMVADNMKGSKHDSNSILSGKELPIWRHRCLEEFRRLGRLPYGNKHQKWRSKPDFPGVVHGVVVLLILMLFAPYASMIPICCDDGTDLMFVAWNMSEKKSLSIL
ncbi:hypothetical protein ACEQPO_25700 [Bacillus sp. SL00103]